MLKTQQDLSLSGINYNKFRNYKFEPDAQFQPIKPTNQDIITPIPTPLRKLPAVPPKYHQSLECILPSKPANPKKSISPPPTQHTPKSNTLDRMHTTRPNANDSAVRKSGSLSTLPTTKYYDSIYPNANKYSVGQPEIKLLTRTPRNVTPKRPAHTVQITDPYTHYSTMGIGRPQSTLKRHKAAIQPFHSSPRGSLTPMAHRSGIISQTEDQRYRVAKEILKTEETYVQNLRTLTSFFYRPLFKSKMLSPHEIKLLFPPQLNSLLSCHTELLEKLRDRLSNTKWHGMVGDIFANLCSGSIGMDFFQMYSGYVLAFPSALAVFDKQIRTNEEFRGFIRACMDSPSCGGLDLCAFLLTPIQRLPRYLLLLKELMKYTDFSHPDSYFANLAHDKFKACLILLNDSIHLVLDIASKSTAWQLDTRAKSNSRSRSVRKSKKSSTKRSSGILRTISSSDLESNSSTINVESCPPSFFNTLHVQSPIIYNKSKRVLKLETQKDTEELQALERKTRNLTLEPTSLEDKNRLPEVVSPPALTSNKSHTDSGIYEDDPDLNQEDIPAFQLHTPIPEHPGYILIENATRCTSEANNFAENDTGIDMILRSPDRKVTEIGVSSPPESRAKGGREKKHFRRRSADRILRLFKLFKSK